MNSAQRKTEKFFSQYPKHTYTKGKIILKPDDELKSLFYIVQGNVRMYALSENGQEATITIFQPGSHFPLMLILSDEKNSYYFESMTNTTCIIAPEDKVVEFITNDPEVLLDVTKRFAKAITGLSKRITESLANNLDERIGSLKTHIEKKFPDGSVHLRHEDIANWLGVSRETISRTMAKKKSSK
jgi:CRP-like cAMP-binding protein